jgi:ABC-type Fe3+ transport system permease subunit
MLRFLSRFLGLWLMAGALVALVVDGAKSIAAGSLVTTPLGAMWYSLSPDTLNGAQAGIQRNVSPVLWDTVFVSILTAPGFVVFGILGALLLLAGRKKRQPRLSELEIG